MVHKLGTLVADITINVIHRKPHVALITLWCMCRVTKPIFIIRIFFLLYFSGSDILHGWLESRRHLLIHYLWALGLAVIGCSNFPFA